MKLRHFMTMLVIAFTMSTTIYSCKGKNRDAEIQTEINNKISSDASSSGITATVSEGVVTLTGECKDAACKTNWEQSAKSIEGVKSVNNNITIAAAEPAPAPVEITADEPLKASANDAVKEYKNVTAEVNNGVITLRGEIKRADLQNLMMKLNALKPKKIENQLVIK